VEFKQTQLANGLTIIAEVSESAQSLAMGFFTRTGARDEPSEIAGVSHFLEHMVFKGTVKRSPFEVNLEFDRMGAQYNAFTSEESTVYYGAVLPEYQERLLALWADLMRPSLREEDFNTEKGVICEEIAMYKDLPHFDVVDRCRRLHFDQHGCGNSVLGTVETVQALTAKQMRDYFSRRYAPDNMVLACAGRMKWDVLVEEATELCGGWQPCQPQRELTDFQGTGHSEYAEDGKVVREHVCLMSGGPSRQSPLRYAASVLANIIGDDTGSRLYWALIDSALADVADMEYDPMDGTGAFCGYLSCDPAQTNHVIGIVKDVLTTIHREGVSNKELQASKNKIGSTVTLSGELPMGRLVPLGYGWVYRRDYRSLAEEIAAIQAVSHDDIKELLETHPLHSPTTLALGPVGDPG